MIPTATPNSTDPRASLAPGLAVDGVKVSFGGNLALSGVRLHGAAGQISGVIGPNGAGKTTLFNVCSGLLKPDAGQISLFGTDVTRTSAAVRARRGLGRTFQRVEVCRSLSVAANVALGSEARIVGRNPLRQVIVPRAERRAIADATSEAMDLCGISHLADRPAGALSTGQCRLVELARVIASGFSFLLLDEPSSGLDEGETDAFANVLQEVARERQIGMLLVEHDMGLVMEICSYVFVLEFGRLIFEGDPASTRSSDVVRAAYLGDGDTNAT